MKKTTKAERMAEHTAAVKAGINRIGRLIACEQDGTELSDLLYTLVTEVAKPTMPAFRAAVAAAWKSIEDEIDAHEAKHPGCFDQEDDAVDEERDEKTEERVHEGKPVTYLHCRTCLAEFYGEIDQPADFPQEPISPGEYARINVRVTADSRLVVECVRHRKDVVRIHVPQMAGFASAPCCGKGHEA